MKRLWFLIAAIAGVGLVVIVAMLLAPKPPIPAEIRNQLSFTLFTSKEAIIDRDTVKFNKNLKLLTFLMKIEDTNTVVSEQSTPESFVDIPQVYDKVVASMNDYRKFEVDAGTVHLTRPTDLKGKQAAVLNSKGTLMFIKPDRDLSDDQWQRFFSSLVVLH